MIVDIVYVRIVDYGGCRALMYRQQIDESYGTLRCVAPSRRRTEFRYILVRAYLHEARIRT